MAKFSAVFLAICVGVLVGIEMTLACNCEVKHPQTQYKEANFVVKAKVLSEYRTIGEDQSSGDEEYSLEYEVQILKVFKGRRVLDSNLVSIFTRKGHSCTIKTMTEGRNYLISGQYEDGRLILDVCSWVELWIDLTREQKKGLKSKYATYCKKCDVPSVSGPELVMMLIDPSSGPSGITEHEPRLHSLSGLWATDPNSCTFNPVDSWQFPATMDCETLYTYCGQNSRKKCGWEINTEYKDCFVDREFEWAKREAYRTTLVGRAGNRSEREYLGCSFEGNNFETCLWEEVKKIVTKYL